MNEPELISLHAAAHRLDISVRGLYRLIARNDLPRPIIVGGSSKLFVRDLEDYLERLKTSRKEDAAAPPRKVLTYRKLLPWYMELNPARPTIVSLRFSVKRSKACRFLSVSTLASQMVSPNCW